MANRTRVLMGFGFFATTSVAAIVVACGTDSDSGDGTAPTATTTTTTTAPTTTATATTTTTTTAEPLVDSGPPPRPEPTLELSAHSAYGTCATKKDGTVLCWGGNIGGMLGRDAGAADPAPTAIQGLRAQTLSTSISAACAVADGGVSCWGSTGSCALNGIPIGEDGGPSAGLSGPVRVNISGADEAITTQAGGCARVGTDVKCWGQASTGVLGSYDAGNSATCSEPVGVSFSGAKALGGYATSLCALKTDGSVWCWGASGGYGEHGRLITDAGPDAAGDLPNGARLAPTQVPGIDNVRSLGTGYVHTCAVKNDGSVWCWGLDAAANTGSPGGQLGHFGPFKCSAGLNCDTDPKIVPGLSNVREVASGVFHTCAVKNDDTVVCWGDSSQYNLLGHNPNEDRDGAAPDAAVNDYVGVPTPKPVVGLSNVAHITAGVYHTCAVTWDSKVFCWGLNQYSALGPRASDGGVPTVLSSFEPVEVTIP